MRVDCCGDKIERFGDDIEDNNDDTDVAEVDICSDVQVAVPHQVVDENLKIKKIHET